MFVKKKIYIPYKWGFFAEAKFRDFLPNWWMFSLQPNQTRLWEDDIIGHVWGIGHVCGTGHVCEYYIYK